ncbi:MAG: hypothetical protein LUD68_00100 [Rikenellaceae bacterium]|nr:hypothetical protein [Rikenellaceae bacterium]
MYTTCKREIPAWITILRIILGIVFITSGLLKGIDPWGTAIKTGEYLHAFGLDWLSGTTDFWALLQCAQENWLGLL